MMFHDVLKRRSQTFHTIAFLKRVVPLSFMIDHCNFQEWLYMDMYYFQIFRFYHEVPFISRRSKYAFHLLSSTFGKVSMCVKNDVLHCNVTECNRDGSSCN